MENLESKEILPLWNKEYGVVLDEYRRLHDLKLTAITKYPSIDLVVVAGVGSNSFEPGHYYSLFSVSRGFDIILSLYSNQRYELEVKYTTKVDLVSRPTFPRIDLSRLASYLNTLEYKTLLEPILCTQMNYDGEEVTSLEF